MQASPVTVCQKRTPEASVVLKEPDAPVVTGLRKRELIVGFEGGSGHRRQKFLLALEVPVQGRLFYPEAPRNRASAHPVETDFVEEHQRLPDRDLSIDFRHA
jgi:hypothetical protein